MSTLVLPLGAESLLPHVQTSWPGPLGRGRSSRRWCCAGKRVPRGPTPGSWRGGVHACSDSHGSREVSISSVPRAKRVLQGGCSGRRARQVLSTLGPPVTSCQTAWWRLTISPFPCHTYLLCHCHFALRHSFSEIGGRLLAPSCRKDMRTRHPAAPPDASGGDADREGGWGIQRPDIPAPSRPVLLAAVSSVPLKRRAGSRQGWARSASSSR